MDSASGLCEHSLRESMAVTMKRSGDEGVALLSEHTHLLLHIHNDPDSTVRELASALGASERQTFRWLSELQQAGYLTRAKQGRRNRYLLNADATLEEREGSGLRLVDLLTVLARESAGTSSSSQQGRARAV
jgi:DNA-binding transcriptional ArsR family regulator